MDSIFNQIMQQDAVNAFAGADDFGELIQVRDASGAESAPFYAQVFRAQPSVVPDSGGMGTPQTAQPSLAVFLPFDATGKAGVKTRPDRGGKWAIKTAEVYGGRAQWMPIVAVPRSDPGGFEVKLR